jgi:hypothetical protein
MITPSTSLASFEGAPRLLFEVLVIKPGELFPWYYFGKNNPPVILI